MKFIWGFYCISLIFRVHFTYKMCVSALHYRCFCNFTDHWEVNGFFWVMPNITKMKDSARQILPEIISFFDFIIFFILILSIRQIDHVFIPLSFHWKSPFKYPDFQHIRKSMVFQPVGFCTSPNSICTGIN